MRSEGRKEDGSMESGGKGGCKGPDYSFTAKQEKPSCLMVKQSCCGEDGDQCLCVEVPSQDAKTTPGDGGVTESSDRCGCTTIGPGGLPPNVDFMCSVVETLHRFTCKPDTCG